MKIFDCFMYFDEDLVLDLRLNYLNQFVDHFIIVESVFNHNGEKKKPQFDIEKFKKFKDKINYILLEDDAKNIVNIYEDDTFNDEKDKEILNALKRENYQRNCIENGLKKAASEDWIIISDIDEIPNLELNNLKTTKNKIVLFKQLMIYYKFNLFLNDFPWIGSKACKKKDLISPQWLRNIKDRVYPFWRIDTLLSKNKYSNIKIFDNGGWHFSYIKTPKNIEKKLKSYLHHTEYELNPLGTNKISDLIKNKKTIYNLKVDTKSNKFSEGNNLTKLDLNLLPKYIKDNKDFYKDWIA